MTTNLKAKNLCLCCLNYKNIKSSIKQWDKEDKAKLAVFSAELVIHLYDGNSDAPKKAIQAARNWLENPTKENAAAAAYHVDAYDFAAATAAAHAAAAHAEVKQKIADYINNKNNELSAKALEEKPETPEQKKEREREMAIYDMCSSVDNHAEEARFWAERFYDAGYRKPE